MGTKEQWDRWRDQWERVELSADVRKEALERSRAGRPCDDLIDAFAQAHGLSHFLVRLYVTLGVKEDAYLMCWRIDPTGTDEGPTMTDMKHAPEPPEGR